MFNFPIDQFYGDPDRHPDQLHVPYIDRLCRTERERRSQREDRDLAMHLLTSIRPHLPSARARVQCISPPFVLLFLPSVLSRLSLLLSFVSFLSFSRGPCFLPTRGTRTAQSETPNHCEVNVPIEESRSTMLILSWGFHGRALIAASFRDDDQGGSMALSSHYWFVPLVSVSCRDFQQLMCR